MANAIARELSSAFGDLEAEKLAVRVTYKQKKGTKITERTVTIMYETQTQSALVGDLRESLRCTALMPVHVSDEFTPSTNDHVEDVSFVPARKWKVEQVDTTPLGESAIMYKLYLVTS